MAFADDLAAERARMAPVPATPQAPAYQFRDDRNAELDRQAGVQTAQIKANPFSGATGSSDGAAPASPFAPAKVPSTGFAGFSNDLEAGAPTPARPSGSNPFAPQGGNQVSGAISRLLQNPAGGYDQSAAIARENAVKANQNANEDLRGQAALSFLPGTGQAFTPVQQQTDQQLLAMRDFDAQTAAGHATAENQGLQTGVNLGLQERGQQISAEQVAKQLAESSRQFNESNALNATIAGSNAALGQGNLAVNQGQLALSTQLGTGDLNLREKTLAQSAGQFTDDLSFKKDALAKGYTEAEAQRAWQATQNDKDRANQTAQFYDTLGLSKEKLAFDKEIGLGNLSLEQTKVANQASQFATQEDFQKYALNAGLDADKAKLAWQSNEAEVARKWNTGERLSSEEYSTLINKSNQTFEAAQSALQDTLKLDIQGNDEKFQAAQTAAAQAYDAAKTDKGMSHEDALAASNQVFQKEMQDAGFTNDQVKQSQQLTQQMNLAMMNRESQETMHMADLASSDKQFGEKLGLDYAQLKQQKDQFTTDLIEKKSEFSKQFGLSMQQFGLTKEQVDQQLSTDQFQALLDKSQIVAQLSKDNPQAMEPMAAQLAESMAKSLNMTPEQIATGKAYSYAQELASSGNGSSDWAKSFQDGAKAKGISDADVQTVLANKDKVNTTLATGPGSPSAKADSFDKIIDNKGALIPDDTRTELKSYTKAMVNAYQGQPIGKVITLDTGHGADFDAAAQRLREKGISTEGIIDRGTTGQTSDSGQTDFVPLYKGTPAFAYYSTYAKLIRNGYSEGDAKDALTAIVGKENADAALALEKK